MAAMVLPSHRNDTDTLIPPTDVNDETKPPESWAVLAAVIVTVVYLGWLAVHLMNQ